MGDKQSRMLLSVSIGLWCLLNNFHSFIFIINYWIYNFTTALPLYISNHIEKSNVIIGCGVVFKSLSSMLKVQASQYKEVL